MNATEKFGLILLLLSLNRKGLSLERFNKSGWFMKIVDIVGEVGSIVCFIIAWQVLIIPVFFEVFK